MNRLTYLLIILPVILCEEESDTTTEDPNPRFLEPQPNLSTLDTCQYLKNTTDLETLNQHQYEILEQCLYYYLASEAQRETHHFNAIQALAALMPSSGQKPLVTIIFHQITLQHFVLNEYLRDLDINGYMDVSWQDDRLSWNEAEWKLKKLEIHSVSHIWVPMLTAQSFDTALRNGDMMEIRRVVANSNGTVRTIINFSLRTYCEDSDFKNFPEDVYKCCFQIEPHINQESVEFSTNGQPVYTDPKYFRDYGWFMTGTVPTVQTAEGSRASQLSFCMNLQRSTNSLKIEMSLPNTVTSILFLLTPFLGQIHIQIAAKMFILFLQFMTLQLFSSRISPHLGSVAATPRILRFLEFAITVNTLSICISIFLWMCSRVKRNLPPWRWLIKTSEVINRCFCVFNTAYLTSAESSVEKGLGSNTYQADWTNAFIAIHGVAVCGLSILFILGSFIYS